MQYLKWHSGKHAVHVFHLTHFSRSSPRKVRPKCLLWWRSGRVYRRSWMRKKRAVPVMKIEICSTRKVLKSGSNSSSARMWLCPFTLGFNFLKWALLVFTAFSPSFTLISVIINVTFFSIFTEEKLQRMPTLRHCPRTGGNAWRKGRWTRNIRSGSYTVQAMFLKTTPTTVIRLSFPSLGFSLNLNFYLSVMKTFRSPYMAGHECPPGFCSHHCKCAKCLE